MMFDDHTLNKLTGLTLAEQIAQSHKNLFNAQPTIVDLASNMSRAFHGSSIVDMIMSSQRNINIFSSPIDILLHSSKFHNQNKSIEEMIIGGSAAYLAQAFANQRKASTLGVFDFKQDVSNIFNQYPDILKKQLSISEQLTRGYFLALNIPLPSWAGKIKSYEKDDDDDVSTFDILTASTANKIHEVIEKNNINENIIDEVSQTLTQPQIQAQFDKFYLNVADLIDKKFDEQKKENVLKLHELINNFLLNTLSKHTKLSKQALQIALDVLYFIVFSLLAQIYLEAKGEDIYNKIFPENEETQNQTIQINNTVEINNYIVKNNTVDFAIEDASVFLNASTKSKYKGRLKMGENVVILKAKSNWSLIRGSVEVKDKKTGEKKDTLLYGWVRNKNLDSFQ